jgi:hypothetical protein
MSVRVTALVVDSRRIRFRRTERLFTACQQTRMSQVESHLRWEHLFKTVLRGKLARAPYAILTHVLNKVLHECQCSTATLDTKTAASPICDRCKPTFNFALNGDRFAPPVDGSCTTKERAMNRLIVGVIGGALLAGGAGLMIAKAQQAGAPAFIAGDRPVTAEQVREKLQTDGWSNIVISRNGRYIEVTGSRDGQAGKMAVDSQTGRLRADADDDDDD